MAKCALEFRGKRRRPTRLLPSLEMGPLGTHTSVCLPSRPQPRKAEPHSFREKVFRKKAPVCAVCKVTIDGTGVSCRGEVLFRPTLSPPLHAPLCCRSRSRQTHGTETNALARSHPQSLGDLTASFPSPPGIGASLPPHLHPRSEPPALPPDSGAEPAVTLSCSQLPQSSVQSQGWLSGPGEVEHGHFTAPISPC